MNGARSFYGSAVSPGAALSAIPSRPLPYVPAVILTQFQASHGYTNNAGSTLAANDTTDFVLGSQAAKITTGGAGAQANLSKLAQAAFDASGRNVRLKVKIDDVTHLNEFGLFLGNSSLAANYKWSVQIQGGSQFLTSGDWVTLTLSFADAAVTGVPTRSALTDVRLFAVDDNTGNPVVLHAGEVALVHDGSSVFPIGVVSVVVDDGYASQFTYGKPKLDQYGYNATIAAIDAYIGTAGRHTLQQMRDARNLSDWKISCHAMTGADHSASFTGLTSAAMTADIRAQRTSLMSKGFRDLDGMHYPLGQHGRTTDGVSTKDIASVYFNYAGTTHSRTKETWPPADPYRLRRTSGISSFAGGTTAAAVLAALDASLVNPTWNILVFHDIVTGSPSATTQISQTDFNAIIDGINARGIPCMAVEDVLSQYKSNAIAVTRIDAKGDMLAGTGPDAVGRLPAGTDGQVLTVSSDTPTGLVYTNPVSGLQPADHGLTEWNYAPGLVTGSAGTPTSGVLQLMKIRTRRARNISSVATITVNTPSGLTAVYGVLYDNTGTLVPSSRSADQSSTWNSQGPGLRTITLGTTKAVPADSYCYAGWWFVGSGTNPTFARASGTSTTHDAGQNNNPASATGYAYATGASGLTSTPPSDLSTFNQNGLALWCGVGGT